MPKKHPASKPRKARKATRRTVADRPKKERAGSLESKLTKAFSLTDCKRILAIAEMWSNDTQGKAAAATREKAFKARRIKAIASGDVAGRKALSDQELAAKDEKDEAKNSIKAAINDIMKVTLECGDGATVWSAAQDASKEEAEGQEPDDKAQLNLNGGDPTTNPLDAKPAD